MRDKTCVKIKNEKQFEKIKEEYERKFNTKFYINFSVCKYYDINNKQNYYHNKRRTKRHFTANNYTILKYKDVRIRKENIVCEKKETFQDCLIKDFNKFGMVESEYEKLEIDLLGYIPRELFHTEKEYTDFLVEKIIVKCIEYYNNMYSEKELNYSFIYKDRNTHDNYMFTSIDVTNMFQKPSMIMNNTKVYENVKREMTNFNGKNLLKYYFCNEW